MLRLKGSGYDLIRFDQISSENALFRRMGKVVNPIFRELMDIMADTQASEVVDKPISQWKVSHFDRLYDVLEGHSIHHRLQSTDENKSHINAPKGKTFYEWIKKYYRGNYPLDNKSIRINMEERLDLICHFIASKKNNSKFPNNWHDFKTDRGYKRTDNQIPADLKEINLEPLSLQETLIRLYKNFNHTSFQVPHYRKLHQVNEYKITNHFFQEPKRCSLLGPSGIGKTAIAKWYCNQWANSPKNLLLPIYVNCAEESFTGDLNDYIHLELFPHKSPQEVIEFLNVKDGYRLILDGFDSLKAQQKENLIEYLVGEGEGLNYTILATVFAFEPYQNVVQSNWELMGFGAESRKLFLKKALGNKSQCSVEEVLSLIEQSEFLWKCMRSPLYLSYIASIAQTDDGLEKLKTPKNTLELKRLFQSCQ
ncbi:hypothetical protein OB69_04415 [Roseivirga seohaensis subsp. aquiponti]|uniref:NACHT domain-containing protein n=1 Tax=Roseivirga seohaensis subsp. aquiponti TaxID=1566026 RepID=A0A0L8ANQ7_9BACT|nr:NACHT domain-containing protein [Roseivirga seohaensis]KOF03807.1 hypothetical protein OB69_04415 [Roseivirga seohaensis subsp. aquiponti]